MGNRTLESFRAGFYGCCDRWGDALFELCDAALCATGPVHSVPSLSLQGEFRRSHGSLYKALSKGRINADALRSALIDHMDSDWPLTFAVDASTWDRCDAECSPERGFYYSASKHSAGQPIVAGWSFQWITQLCHTPDSWTAPVDVERIKPSKNVTDATVAQIRRLVELLPDDREVPLFVFDAGYDPIAISYELSGTRVQTLTRIRDDRVFYTKAPPKPDRPPGTGGRPPRHGTRMKCSEANTWGEPTDTLAVADKRYGNVTVASWSGLHPKLHHRGHWEHTEALPIVEGTVIRVEVEHLPKPTARTKKTLWLFHSGPHPPNLDEAWRTYLRRFDIEHTFRFAKNTLGWTTPALRTPEQAERWTWLIAAALTQLRLARAHVSDLRLPWERRREPNKLTPARVRRGFRQLRAALGTPARPPKPSRAGPGRPKGTPTGPRQRHPAIKKAA